LLAELHVSLLLRLRRFRRSLRRLLRHRVLLVLSFRILSRRAFDDSRASVSEAPFLC
jgi:hypothetical protein